MEFLKFLLIFIYILLIYFNYTQYKNKGTRTPMFLTMITVILSTVMLFSTNIANLDWSITEADVSGYRTLYELYNLPEHPDYNAYFIFYRIMDLGKSMGLSYRMWWVSMSVMAMAVIIIACKIHEYNINVFLASFMAYYEFVFYSGFKFFYGFCFLLLAYGFLLRNTKKDKILFSLFTFIAAGFHVMYWLFFLLLIKPVKRPKLFVTLIVLVALFLTVLGRLSSSALYFLGVYLGAFDNEHISSINNATIIKIGFYIVLFVHLITVYVAYRVRLFKIKEGENTVVADTLFYTVLLSLIFCPLYTITLTFMRYITAFSLVVITASSSMMSKTYKERTLCVNLSFFMVMTFHIMKLITGGFGFYEREVGQFFNIF